MCYADDMPSTERPTCICYFSILFFNFSTPSRKAKNTQMIHYVELARLAIFLEKTILFCLFWAFRNEHNVVSIDIHDLSNSKEQLPPTGLIWW